LPIEAEDRKYLSFFSLQPQASLPSHGSAEAGGLGNELGSLEVSYARGSSFSRS
jgi:hypothetical protein